MRVLVDRHHADLYESLLLLMEDRFGWEVFTPVGMDWFNEGIWNFERAYHGDAVARQYLVGWWGDDADCGCPIVKHADPTHPGRIVKGVTLAAARDMAWDLVISTLPDNDRGLHHLAQDKRAKFGIQLGNVNQMSAWELADFGLCSTSMPYTPPKPFVVYRQEFSLTDFRYERPPNACGCEVKPPFKVRSFVQCLPENPLAYAEFLQYARQAPDLDWGINGSYGSHETDEFACGNLENTPSVAAAMRATDVIWHTKEWSDGYGHVIHNAFAVGRPVFGIAGYYADKLAGPLWVDGETSIDIAKRTQDEVLMLLRRLRDDPDEHLRMSENAAKRFREVVDFDAEAAQIRMLLDDVLSDRLVAA